MGATVNLIHHDMLHCLFYLRLFSCFYLLCALHDIRPHNKQTNKQTYIWWKHADIRFSWIRCRKFNFIYPKKHTILHLKPPYSWFRKCFFHVRYYGAFLVCIFVYGYLFVHVSFVIPLGGGLALYPLKCRKIQLHFWNGVSTVEHYAPFRIQWINVYEERERE